MRFRHIDCEHDHRSKGNVRNYKPHAKDVRWMSGCTQPLPLEPCFGRAGVYPVYHSLGEGVDGRLPATGPFRALLWEGGGLPCVPLLRGRSGLHAKLVIFYMPDPPL